MTGRTLPEGWQDFNGHTSEFRKLERMFSDLSPGVDGYLAAADDIYAGNMHKTFKNLSAVAKMTGRTLPEGWQECDGHTSEFDYCRNWIAENPNASKTEFISWCRDVQKNKLSKSSLIKNYNYLIKVNS